jgi:CDP-paratose 2-epimerase
MSKILVTGGAGFIGFHAATRYLREGHEVHVLDNLSRNGARANFVKLESMQRPRNARFRFHHVDLRVAGDVAAVFAEVRPDFVVHEAAQVAVTTSVVNPRLDFEINAFGTFNVLEAARLYAPDAFLVYASTNKVYGGMEDVAVVEEAKRYRYRDYPEGLDESRTLDFHSPYACSKGAADQYVHDYSRIFGLRTVVFRQSCIYGTDQFGVEDQGWIAWFTIARVLGRPVTIYGSGKQVRDILWVEDLVEAYDRAWKRDKGGQVYNMGGGAENTLSLLELVEILDGLQPSTLPLQFGDVRPGDQPVYIANATKARRELEWSPRMKPAAGVERLHAWVKANRDEVTRVLES